MYEVCSKRGGLSFTSATSTRTVIDDERGSVPPSVAVTVTLYDAIVSRSRKAEVTMV